MKKLFLVFILITFFFVHNCVAQFDTTTLNKQTVYFFLISQDSAKKERALNYIADSTSSIDSYSLMLAGMTLYAEGYKDSSMYWLYLGDIRARFLASLYTQRSDAALYSSLHQIIIEVTKDYAKNNVQTLYKKINRALEFASLNPLKPLEFLETPTDTLQHIPIEEWKQHYDIVRQSYHHLELEILQNGNAIFEDDTRKKSKPKYELPPTKIF